MTPKKKLNSSLQDNWGYNKKYLDFIVSSGEIKKLILDRAEILGLSIYQVCEEAGMNYDYFKKFYLQKQEPQCSFKLRQLDLIRIAAVVVVEIRLTILTTPIDQVETEHIKGKKFVNRDAKRQSREDQDFGARYSS